MGMRDLICEYEDPGTRRMLLLMDGVAHALTARESTRGAAGWGGVSSRIAARGVPPNDCANVCPSGFLRVSCFSIAGGSGVGASGVGGSAFFALSSKLPSAACRAPTR